MEVDVMGSMMISRIDSNFDVMEECSRIFEEGILQQRGPQLEKSEGYWQRVEAFACLLHAKGFCLLCFETSLREVEKVRSVISVGKRKCRSMLDRNYSNK